MNRKTLKRKILSAISVLLFATASLGYVKAAPNEEVSTWQEAEENEILVVYDDAGVSDTKSETIQEEANQILEDMDITVTEEISESDEKMGTIVAAEIPVNKDVQEISQELMEEDRISYAQPNYIYHTLDTETQYVTNDEYVVDVSQTYYLDNAHVKEAWDLAKCEKTVTIAVLDTGCRLDHADLENNISDKAYDVYYGEPLTVDSTVYGGDAAGGGNLGHGTHVCGLIAAEADNGIGIAGTSYNAEIIPVKIFDDEGKNATTKSMLNGLIYCQNLIDNNEVENLHVINLSAGTYFNSGTDMILENQIEKLADDYNVLCVCAGGNGDGTTRQPLTDPLYPSDFDACLSVTSLNKEGDNSSWSDYNMQKDISAPGEKILSTYCERIDGKDYYKNMSGTSMSAPIVSGICALLWAENPDLTVEQVKAAIESTADPVPSNATDGREGLTGSFGAVNAKAALEYVKNINDPSKVTTIISDDVTLSDTSYTYSAEKIKPDLTVEHDGITLVKNQDYTVSYKNNLNAGTAQVTVQGIKNYTGTVKKNFTIEKQKISKCTYSISAKNFLYVGEEICPSVKIYYKSKAITPGVDYTIAYSNNIDAGTAQVTVTGCGTNFTGVGRFYYTIQQKDIGNLSPILSATSYTYTGKTRKPSVKLTYLDMTLISGKDFKLTYSNNVKVGTAKVTITGIGNNYTGSLTKSFKINPKGTSISKLSKRSKGFVVKWKKQSSQTDGYQIQYATNSSFKSAKTKTVKSSKTTTATISKLKKKKSYYVRIRTYKTVSGKKYYSGWSTVKKIKTL
ncbi:MAG: S8 family peptidase [Lachnospiraceae bacterium]